MGVLGASTLSLLLLTSPCRAAAPDVPAEAALTFASTGRGKPAPLVVSARVADKATLLLVDSGAGGVWLDRSLAGDGEIELSFGSWKGRVSARAFAMPDDLLRAGIGGVLAPQRLAGAGFSVLDLPGRRLLVYARPWAEARGQLETAFPLHAFEELPLQKGLLPPKEDADQDHHAVVMGALEGLPEAPMLLDSGAAVSRLRDVYVGKKAGSSLPGPLKIRLGGHDLRLPAAEVGPHREGGDVAASLGRDAISRLVLAFGPPSTSVWIGFPKP